MNLDSVLAASGDGAFAIDPDGRIVVWNRAAEKMLGYTADEVIGRPCCELFGDATGSADVCYRECTLDMRIRTKTGSEIWVNTSALSVSTGRPVPRRDRGQAAHGPHP